MNGRRWAPWQWNWKWRLTDNSWRAAAWDRSAPVIVAMALVLLLFSSVGNVLQGYVLIRSGDNHHAQSARQNGEIQATLAEHSALLKEIVTLQQQNAELGKQHTADIANESQLLTELKSADTELASLAAYLIKVDLALCSSDHASCPALPSLPGISP